MDKVVLIVSDRIGGANNPELGGKLMRNFIYSLARNEAARPSLVLFFNDGVKLACEGSESLDDLVLLAEAGVGIKACGTCLDYLGLKDALKVGEVGTMPDSVAALMDSSDVVTVC
jgi:selenium metabolism protein YedF